jgi:hypothetical protein
MASPLPRPSRRHFLRQAALGGGGLSIALPHLPTLAASTTVADVPTRMAFLYIPNGVNVGRWMPTGVGTDYTLGPSLEPLAAHRQKLSFISGLAHRNGFAGPDGAGDHARATATFLTATRPLKTAGADLRAGISADQVAARQVGDRTRFPSLELSCDAARKSGGCDSGYSCAYQFNLSWRSERQPATPESNPRLVFERLFGGGNDADRRAFWQAREATRRSVLDFVLEESASLRRQLGGEDVRKLDDYLDGIREVERRLDRAAAFGIPEPPAVTVPDRPPTVFSEHVRLLSDMLVLAFQTDSTRIATFMFAHDGSNRSFPEIGVGDGHHALSHHKDDPETLEKIAKIDRLHAEQFAYLLGRLDAIREADGRSLLDHCMMIYAGGLSDGNRHRHDNLPVILAGSAGGRLVNGRHIALQAEQPMANLLLTMLDTLGVTADAFGDSTGRLDALRV